MQQIDLQSSLLVRDCSTVTGNEAVLSFAAPEGPKDLAGGAAPGNLAPAIRSPEGAKESQENAMSRARSFRPFGADS